MPQRCCQKIFFMRHTALHKKLVNIKHPVFFPARFGLGGVFHDAALISHARVFLGSEQIRAYPSVLRLC